MARLRRTILTAGALAALPFLASHPAAAEEHGNQGAGPSAEVNSTAYPKAPGGMPAAADKGQPVTPASDPAAKPGPANKASTEGAATKVGTPSTAYPGAPGGGPAASDHGTPIKP